MQRLTREYLDPPVGKGAGECDTRKRDWAIDEAVYAIVGDLEGLRRQLFEKDKRAADDIDRDRAEGYFRIAVGPPLLALVGVGALVVWHVVALVLAVVAAIPIVRLISSGIRRQRSADDYLMRQVSRSRIAPPLLAEAIDRASAYRVSQRF